MTFGATDAPLKADDLEASGLEQWPMVMGGIVPVVNLDGVKSGDLVIDGPTLAKIYLGTITKWNDPAIKALNPKVALPDLAIAVIHRADGSGTTFNFTNYLDKVSPEWQSKIGESTSVEWPVGIGAKGNDGVANNVAGTKGAIGYVEYAYAKQNKLTYADMVNKDGKTVAPTIEAFQAAAANADWAKAPGFYLILSNQPGAESWPMTAATFILMYKKPVDVTQSNEALKFFDILLRQGRRPGQGARLHPDARQRRRAWSRRPGRRTSRRSKAIALGVGGPAADSLSPIGGTTKPSIHLSERDGQ